MRTLCTGAPVGSVTDALSGIPPPLQQAQQAGQCCRHTGLHLCLGVRRHVDDHGVGTLRLHDVLTLQVLLLRLLCMLCVFKGGSGGRGVE